MRNAKERGICKCKKSIKLLTYTSRLMLYAMYGSEWDHHNMCQCCENDDDFAWQEKSRIIMIKRETETEHKNLVST